MKKVKETKWVCDFCGKGFDRKRDCDAHEHMVHNHEKAAVKVEVFLCNEPSFARWNWWEKRLWVNEHQIMLNVLPSEGTEHTIGWYCYCDPGKKNVDQARLALKNYIHTFLDESHVALESAEE